MAPSGHRFPKSATRAPFSEKGLSIVFIIDGSLIGLLFMFSFKDLPVIVFNSVFNMAVLMVKSFRKFLTYIKGVSRLPK